MHSALMLLGVVLASLMRWWCYAYLPGERTYSQERWLSVLGLFLLPPIFVAMTAIAVLTMGHHGTMLGMAVGKLGCHAVMGLVAIALGCLFYQAGQSWWLVRQVVQLPQQTVQNIPSRCLNSPQPFAARVGFWQAHLVLSPALFQQLNETELEAVLHHEQAHLHYRDTFWFFWLAWVRRLTGWLPHTEALWQELLLLRELRADAWAAQWSDPLTIAEALLKLGQGQPLGPSWQAAPFNAALVEETTLDCHWEIRIQALIQAATQSETVEHPSFPSQEYFLQKWIWGAMAGLICCLPLFSNLYHSTL